ncbi:MULTISPECIES: DNA phosphorothioation-associated putative methyltransferase [unclassified Endozoicomonas]|uniref:DNA phosphorothioation-associated putative methyltransferase n=1 Tax=unclassified Endozoicomonas TaxID=2644528 RepID=UPI003BB7F894
MSPEQYHEYVDGLSIGKKLPKAVYLHKSALQGIEEQLKEYALIQVVTVGLKEQDWDILKFHRDGFRLTLLSYPAFFSDAYPALHKSISIDLAKQQCKQTCYQKTDNPPILHRKELMVQSNSPHYEDFCLITQEGELAGLYENSRAIGFKRSWESLLESKGYTLVDGRLFRSAAVDSSEVHTIDRHKTALSRNDLSTPMRSLANHGYLDGRFSVFDYGCGHSDDLRELEAHGITAQGWDPNWRPEGSKVNADLVNLGFVINVIEDIEERVDALLGAWRLTDKLLVIAAMLGTEAHVSKFKAYKDGVITSRNTFQKYYSQPELQSFIEQVLEEEPIAVGPGVFYVFKDKEEEQLYLANKGRRRQRWRQLSQKTVRVPKVQQVLEKHSELVQSFWERCLELGRLPALEELDARDKIKRCLGSPKQSFKLACLKYDQNDFLRSEQQRKEELLIYFALQLFSKRRPYKSMPEQLKRDIKVFFGNYRSATEESKNLLFSLAQPDLINQKCEEAHQSLPASILNGRHSLIMHTRFIDQLPIELQLYIGCATQLYGEIEGVDLIKIHIRSGKLSLMVYDGFETQPLPMLRERVKVNMRAGRIEFFDYGYGDYEPQPLYWKSKLIDDSFSDYSKQLSFDRRLQEMKLLDESKNFGPTMDELTRVLKGIHCFEVRGYRFFRVNG